MPSGPSLMLRVFLYLSKQCWGGESTEVAGRVGQCEAGACSSRGGAVLRQPMGLWYASPDVHGDCAAGLFVCVWAQGRAPHLFGVGSPGGVWWPAIGRR